jgi:hypothetical protein
MKSINVKRIAAVAAGVAMVGSVMASGLAVTQQGEVTSLVSNIKANLDNAQVVVGTQGADISDGVQAAKIAAVLASVNYAAVSTGTVSITDKSVVLETSAGATEVLSPSTYPVDFPVLAAGTSGHWASITQVNSTLTKDTLSAILAQKTLQATVNGSSGTYNYQDQIRLNQLQVTYDEATGSAYPGYGLFLSIPTATVPTASIEYRVSFDTPLPVGTGRSYSSIPEINVLGYILGIDYANVLQNSLPIYSGTKQTMVVGDEVTTADSYTVRLDLVTQGSGNIYYAIYTATDPSGATATSDALVSGQEWNFFGSKVGVRVDFVGYDQSAAKGTTMTRVTSGKKTLTTNIELPWDSNWVVKEINVSSSGATGLLNFISLKYRGPVGAQTFSGTAQTGLKQGVVLNGPLTKDGTPKYQMKLKGFGSASKIVNTANVVVDGIGISGTSMTSTHLLKPSWTARDGMAQVMGASSPDQVAIPADGATALSLSTLSPWAIINDKVVKWVSFADAGTSGSVQMWNLKFEIGGENGVEVTAGPMNASGGTGTLTYTSSANPISCPVTLGSAALLDQQNITLTGSSTCDIVPDQVQFGAATMLSIAPYMDLRYIQGNATVALNKQPVSFNESAVTKYWPVMKIVAPSSAENVTVVYDSEAASDNLVGLRAYLNLNDNGTAGMFLNAQAKTKLVDESATANSGQFYENNRYDYTPFSTELALSELGTKKLSVTVPAEQRNAIFEISQVIGNGTTTGGTYTATEGQTVGNVKIDSIACTASVSGANLYSPTKTVQPESLIALDTPLPTATYQIVVGGPWVNLVAQGIAGNALTTTGAGASYLIADGNKLLVAGFTAADTASAADALVVLLKA